MGLMATDLVHCLALLPLFYCSACSRKLHASPSAPHPGVEREGLPGLSSPPDLHSPGAPQERKPACPRTRFHVLKPLGVAPPGRRYPSRPTTESLKRVTRTSPEALILPGHLAGSPVSGRFEPSGDLDEIRTDRDLDQGVKLGSSERDRSRVVQGTSEQEGQTAGGGGATSLGCCGVSQQLHLMGLQGDLAVGEIEDDVPHQPQTRPLVGTTRRSSLSRATTADTHHQPRVIVPTHTWGHSGRPPGVARGLGRGGAGTRPRRPRRRPVHRLGRRCCAGRRLRPLARARSRRPTRQIGEGERTGVAQTTQDTTPWGSYPLLRDSLGSPLRESRRDQERRIDICRPHYFGGVAWTVLQAVRPEWTPTRQSL